jgi:hypothetical protein
MLEYKTLNHKFVKFETNSVPSWPKTQFLMNYLAETPATWQHRCWCFSSLPLWHPVGSPANCVLSRTGNTTVSPPISGEMAGPCPVGAYPVGKGVGGRPHNACRGFQVSNVLFSAVLWIRDVYTESRIRFFHPGSQIPDPGSKRFRIQVRIKEFKYF